jgi:hypothetical protein
LFINRTPISEACQGVLNTLKEFGLESFIEKKCLDEIRKWTRQFSVDEYIQMVFKISNVKYAVMTNIPYETDERAVWINTKLEKSQLVTDKFKSALRIDLFMLSDWKAICDIIVRDNFEPTKDGLREYLEKWIQIMSPEYLMVYNS